MVDCREPFYMQAIAESCHPVSSIPIPRPENEALKVLVRSETIDELADLSLGDPSLALSSRALVSLANLWRRISTISFIL